MVLMGAIRRSHRAHRPTTSDGRKDRSLQDEERYGSGCPFPQGGIFLLVRRNADGKLELEDNHLGVAFPFFCCSSIPYVVLARRSKICQLHVLAIETCGEDVECEVRFSCSSCPLQRMTPASPASRNEPTAELRRLRQQLPGIPSGNGTVWLDFT